VILLSDLYLLIAGSCVRLGWSHFNDLMENIEWFLNLHDNKDGYLTKDEVLTLSELLLVRRRFRSADPFINNFLVRFPI